jgi:hypothetical protein
MAQSSWNMVLGSTIMMFVPLYLVLQIWFASVLRGRWRLAALVPLIGFVPALIVAFVALARDSNLWPITVILFAPLGCAYLLLLGLANAFLARRRTS